MGQWKPITNPETLAKVDLARRLKGEGKTDEEIAGLMQLSVSRIRELLRGENWDSRA